jgi:phage shock protein PspC (stress-responsive transcriptional regulator)
MKKTLTVNLNGRVFNIDEDAYHLLDDYLNNLRIYFQKEEGEAEILADFEARIEELFSERVRIGYTVIDIEQVEKVIAQMGRPDDFEGSDEREKNPFVTTAKKKFYRNPDDKMFAGLFSGLAAYFDWNVLVVRIIALILIPATSFWIIPVYLVFWLIAPEARTAQEKLEMQGKPITVENIGKAVAAKGEQSQNNNHDGCLSSVINFFVAFFKVCIVGLSFIIGIPLLFVLIVIIIVTLILFGISIGFLTEHSFSWPHNQFLSVEYPSIVIVGFCLLLGIPLLILVYSFVSYLLKIKPVHPGLKWTGLIIWIIALIMIIFSGFRLNRENIFHTIRNKTDLTGNGVLSNRVELLPPIQSMEWNGNFEVDLQVKYIKNNNISLSIQGDSNLIDQIQINVNNEGQLILSVSDNFFLKPVIPFSICLQTPVLNGIKSGSIGNIRLTNALYADNFFIKLNGAGKLTSDSLYCKHLKVKTEGIGSVTLGGAAKKAVFEMDGAGEINAIELISDSVYAQVNGIGSVKCNPVRYLQGNMIGIGKITYKTEPPAKNTNMVGIGKIGLE